MKLTIGTVDMDCFNGREHHPQESDQGLTGRVIFMEVIYIWADEDDDSMMLHDGEPITPEFLAGLSEERLRRLAAIGEHWGLPGDRDFLLDVYTILLPDGRLLEVMEHEVGEIK